MSKELIAIYELKRQSYLLGYIQNPDKLSPSLAYAYQVRMKPAFHTVSEQQIYGYDPFEDVYENKSELFNNVIDYIHDNILKEDYENIAFYKLEDKYGRGCRMELIHILTYCRINGEFDQKTWNAIEKYAPAEANKIDSKFEPRDVSI